MAFIHLSELGSSSASVRTLAHAQETHVEPIFRSIIIFTTFFLIVTGQPTGRWATFLGVSSAMLAAIQYAPQIMHTYNAKLVGALSIPMMLIQSPGAVLMVLSIALRPGTNWTSAF